MRNTGFKLSIPYISATLLFICFSLLLLLSFGFGNGNPPGHNNVIWFVALLIISSIPYLLSVRTVLCSRVIKCTVWFIFITGILLRLLVSFSTPVLEVDYYRYMWDGAVVSEGVNPYIYSPQQVLDGTSGNKSLEDIAGRSEGVIERINHKHLKTIYPPVTQLYFSISHLINPWSLLIWKLVLVFIDIINFFLLLRILRNQKINVLNSLIYWWNPLLITTTFNAGHFDIIPLTFVLGSIFLVLTRKINTGVLSLALGVGSKLWPVFIFPVLIRPFLKNRKKIFINTLLFIAAIGILFIPFFLSGIGPGSGLVVYSSSWENNSSVFRIFLYIFETIFEHTGIHPGHAQKYSRLLVMTVITAVVVTLFMKKKGNQYFLQNILIVVAALFLLSPTQFPWYYTWLIPFIALRPHWSLLVLTLTLPLYYLGYYFKPEENYEFIRNIIICAEFLPVWLLILYEWKGKYIVKAN